MTMLLAHLGVPPFVQQAALAMMEEGILADVVTTLVPDDARLWQRLLCGISGIVGFDLKSQLARRDPGPIPLEKITCKPVGELLRLLANRAVRDKRIEDRVFHWHRDRFDRQVGRMLRNGGYTSVYTYEYTARETLKVARERGLSTIYDVPSPQHDEVYRILNPELEKFPELITPWDRKIRGLHDKRTAYRRAEFDAADLVVAASNFTRETFAKAGWPTDRIAVVPYGAPPTVPQGLDGGTKGQGPVRFLWAGTFSLRKGGHLLLDAWRKVVRSTEAELHVYGAMALPERILSSIPTSIKLYKPINRTQLMEKYQEADMLLFPTLCDGFGMVAMEAWSRGCPVLSTRNAGASDFLTHHQNGLLIPAGSIEAIADAIRWCLDHRGSLAAMRAASLQTAESWQWPDYRAALREVVNTVINRQGIPV